MACTITTNRVTTPYNRKSLLLSTPAGFACAA
jgi:hypothetical protein